MSRHLRETRARLRRLGDAEIAAHSQRFFKTGKGEYVEGDRFLGVRVPVVRREARRCRDTPVPDLVELLQSAYHEERLLALIALVERYRKGDEAVRREIYAIYLGNTKHVNNWDLVDVSAHNIVGPHLESRSRRPLDRLSRSKSLWERRIAVMATLHFIRNGAFDDTLRIAERLLDDPEDLIHKAVGWMLRYAIEKFPEPERKAFLAGKV